ncbi:hypothetical protein pdam_00016258 [Pocillopora damicornis]|uniref:EF-hand domain-containing protein n=1 Tax=Pocillopora damicornis TaxID=46731 RepID=A0A3M6UGV5_POCDA|nr:calmodulin-A-like [Pocillopora damicornis]XP_027035821.1 calmodulin-A-like [Pocillopora damicornis]RMX52883.1 hypothetical protein pdam_00016258 [Pocillopora damicornis]
MESLTREQIGEYREAFKCFDLNENGTLSTKELKYAMRMLGSNPTDSQVQELVNEKDFDGDGTINFEEFVNMIEDQNSAEDEDNLFTIFSVFDPEHNGFVEGKNIKKSLLCLDDVPVEELDEIIQKAGITDDRKLTMEEFSTLLVPLIYKSGRILRYHEKTWTRSNNFEAISESNVEYI